MAEDIAAVVVTERFRTDTDPLQGSFFTRGLLVRNNGKVEEFASFTCNNIEEHYIQSMCQQQQEEWEAHLRSEEEHEALLRTQDVDAYLDSFELPGLTDPCTVDQYLEANPPYEEQQDAELESDSDADDTYD